MNLLPLLPTIFGAVLFCGGTGYAAEPLKDEIERLEPLIEAYPPKIQSQKELKAVKSRYENLKAQLDRLLAAAPRDAELLFLRGHLQRMGHNFDYPYAWQAAASDLRTALSVNPEHRQSFAELVKLFLNVSASVSRDMGTIRADVKGLKMDDTGVVFGDYEIGLYKRRAQSPFQRIAVEIEKPDPYIKFADIDGDGHPDLLLYGRCGSYFQCVGPFPWAADVYLYVPRKKRFQFVEALSHRGEVRAAGTKGCATVEYKSGLAGYTTEKWCFNRRQDAWLIDEVSGGEPTEE